jgi:hypothetical protein
VAGPTTAIGGNPVNVRTEQGDIVLAHRVAGQSIMISAGQPPGGAIAHVIFAGGYLQTPTGRVVKGLDPPMPTVMPVRLTSSLSVSFLVFAGHVAQTVDGLLSDVGLNVTVDFIQPADARFVSINSRIQPKTDASGSIVASHAGFGPFSFKYDDQFLFEKTLEASSREQLFDIVISATQDQSIQVVERVGNDPRVTVTTGLAGTVVSSQPLNEAKSVLPVILQVPVAAPFQFPAPPPAQRIFTPPSQPPAFVQPNTTTLQSAGLIDITAASSGAAATDRPRLFLVWRLPGLEDQTGRKEFPIVVLAPRYLRALVAELPQGTYWFEMEEPGADARPIGEKFYVRGGRIDVDVLPEDLGLVPDALPQTDAASESVPVAVPVPDDAASDGDRDDLSNLDDDGAEEVSDVETTEVESISVAGASAVGAVGLLKTRWRRRFEAATVATPPRFDKVSRLSRRIRRAAK